MLPNMEASRKTCIQYINDNHHAYTHLQLYACTLVRMHLDTPLELIRAVVRSPYVSVASALQKALAAQQRGGSMEFSKKG